MIDYILIVWCGIHTYLILSNRYKMHILLDNLYGGKP